jgi:uncharacterized protein
LINWQDFRLRVKSISLAWILGETPMLIEEKLRKHRTEISHLARARGAYNLRVFGSLARGEATDKSDIDILVDLEPGRTLFDLGGLLIDLQGLLDCQVDIVTEKGLRPRIRQQVLAEAIPL